MSESPTAVLVRPAMPEDAAALERLIEPFVAERKLLPRTLEDLVSLCRNGFVAESAGAMVGFAALEIYSKKFSEIQCLAVRSDFQKQGIGKRLVDACVELARQNNILEVMAITSSESLFRGCGFDFALPEEKKALFLRTRDPHAPNP